MKKCRIIFVSLAIVFAASPAFASQIFEWKELTGVTYVKPVERTLRISISDSVALTGTTLTGIGSIDAFDVFLSYGGGVSFDINDLYEPDRLKLVFDDSGTQIKFFQQTGHETSQAAIWFGLFQGSPGRLRLSGNFDSIVPFDPRITYRYKNGYLPDSTPIIGNFFLVGDPPPQVPEPATLLLFGFGLLAMAGVGRVKESS